MVNGQVAEVFQCWGSEKTIVPYPKKKKVARRKFLMKSLLYFLNMLYLEDK